MLMLTTQAMVKSLVDAHYLQSGSLRQKHVYEQTLLSLVRLAKSEQLLEIRTNVKKLTGDLPVTRSRAAASRAAAARLAQLALPGLDDDLAEHAPKRRQ